MPVLLPYFKFNPHDWTTSESILKMTGAQVGAYILLLAYAWMHETCTLPNDLAMLYKLARWTGTDEDFAPVRSCFSLSQKPKGRLVNHRLYREWQLASDQTEKKRQGGVKGAQIRWAEPTKTSPPIPNGIATWEHYATAYQQRYHVPPVRNKTVNSQLKQLVDRLGSDDAPNVAAFYLTHNKPLYVSARHPANLLLRDAEGLRTEWATGIKATTSEARNAEVQDEAREQIKRVRANMEARKHGSS